MDNKARQKAIVSIFLCAVAVWSNTALIWIETSAPGLLAMGILLFLSIAPFFGLTCLAIMTRKKNFDAGLVLLIVFPLVVYNCWAYLDAYALFERHPERLREMPGASFSGMVAGSSLFVGFPALALAGALVLGSRMISSRTE